MSTTAVITDSTADLMPAQAAAAGIRVAPLIVTFGTESFQVGVDLSTRQFWDKLLAPGAPLYLYGAYRQAGVATASSNEAFDLSLRTRDPEWGLRDLEDVVAVAKKNGLDLDRVVSMPANNLSVVFRRI